MYEIMGRFFTESQVLFLADCFMEDILKARRNGEVRIPNDFEFKTFSLGNYILGMRERKARLMAS